MGTFIKVKHRRAICFKFGDIILIFLIKVVLEAKDRSTQLRKIYFYIVASFWYLLSLL